MTYAECFAGIGGWSLGLQACGWELKWQCERDAWCRRLLTERFGVPIYDDIRTICEQSPPPVDALIGSPPCQPFSIAGFQDGASDERHLYPAFIRLVAKIQPRWVLMEQVPNILSIDGGRAFAEYIGGLVALGFDVCWHRIPACAVGGDQERPRLWIIAHSLRQRAQGLIRQGGNVCENGQGGAGSEAYMRPTNWRTRSLFGGEAQPILCRRTDGIPNWAHRIKGLGNAIVPQIAQIIGQAINQIESEPIV